MSKWRTCDSSLRGFKCSRREVKTCARRDRSSGSVEVCMSASASCLSVCLVGVYALGVDWCLGRECHVVWKQKEDFVADETKMSP